MLAWVGVTVGAYLLGSIPSGLWVGRFIFGIDPRDYGSKRSGATNVLRTMGKKAAIAVLLLDVLKAVLAVQLARAVFPLEPWAHVLAAIAAAAGHNWPVFSGFRGGKGVVVSGTGVGALYWPLLIFIVPVGVALVWRTRYVSLGSMGGSIVGALAAIIFFQIGYLPFAYLAFVLLAAALVVWSHRENVSRLQAGTENRLGHRVTAA